MKIKLNRSAYVEIMDNQNFVNTDLVIQKILNYQKVTKSRQTTQTLFI